jgi:hypothetical protein
VFARRDILTSVHSRVQSAAASSRILREGDIAKVAVLTSELPGPGGMMGRVGTFTLHWSRLLQQAGEDVTVVLTHFWRGTVFAASWRTFLEDRGIRIIELVERDYPEDRQPYLGPLDMSERVADLLEPFSAVYFQDYAGVATILIRRGRLPATGDDCLVPAMCAFESDGSPLDASGQMALPVKYWAMPLGPAATAALLQPDVLGGPRHVVRRSAFEALGGYREMYGVAREDWELLPSHN